MTIKDIAMPPQAPELARFWSAAEGGELLIKRCTACGEAHWYPRVFCPFCHSPETVWEKCNGKANVYSYTVVRSLRAYPFALAYVVLAAGPAMYIRFADPLPEKIIIGCSVDMVFERGDDGYLVPMARLAIT